MSNSVHSPTAGASLGGSEALLAGVIAAAQAAFPGGEGLDPLVWGASCLGDQATLRYLLANGGGTSWTPPYCKDEDEEDDQEEFEGGNSCLKVASRMGHGGAVRELLESGVDVDEVLTDDGITALYIAASSFCREGVVDELLKAGADVNKAATYDGSTPLHCAAKEGYEPIVEKLLEAGADVNKAWTDNGTTPLFIAALYNYEGVVELLLKAGADVNKARTDDGSIPLHRAALNGYDRVVELLLKAGADVNKAATVDGATPLYLAAQEGHEGTIYQLLEAGADPNAQRSSGRHRTSLGVASSRGHSRICSLLLEAGANVNGSATAEVPPLTNAVACGHREMTLVLMEHGASSSDESLTPAMLKNLTKWMAEALKENQSVVREKNRQIDQMVHGIPEWCAQAASCVADEEVPNGGDASAQLHPSCAVGLRKRKSPSDGE